MKIKIELARRLTTRLILANFAAKEDKALTLLLSGAHGIGKSQVLKAAAKKLGGYTLTVEGGSLKEGEITGIPFKTDTSDGFSEITFIPHPSVATIQRMQREYYKTANEDGFLDGNLKLTEKGLEYKNSSKEDSKFEIIEPIDVFKKIVDGEINKYEFGNDMPFELKLELIATGEIKPVVLFIDELNRTDQQTMKELMNIILNKNVNGYKLPWWVVVVAAINPASQNSEYATLELDPAQLSRFLKLTVRVSHDDWIDYAINSGLDQMVINGVTSMPDIFKINNTYEDNTKMTADPRSLEMLNYLYETASFINNFRSSRKDSIVFFTDEERKELDGDISLLFQGKIGDEYGRTLYQNIKNSVDYIKPTEIITGKSANIDKDVVDRFKVMKTIKQKVIADATMRHLAEIIFPIWKQYRDKKSPESIKLYENISSQISEFILLNEKNIQFLIAKKITNDDYPVQNAPVSTSLFTLLMAAFRPIVSLVRELGANLEI